MLKGKGKISTPLKWALPDFSSVANVQVRFSSNVFASCIQPPFNSTFKIYLKQSFLALSFTRTKFMLPGLNRDLGFSKTSTSHIPAQGHPQHNLMARQHQKTGRVWALVLWAPCRLQNTLWVLSMKLFAHLWSMTRSGVWWKMVQQSSYGLGILELLPFPC